MNHWARRMLKSYSGRTRYSKGGVVGNGKPVKATLSAGEQVLANPGAMTSLNKGKLTITGTMTFGPIFRVGDKVRVKQTGLIGVVTRILRSTDLTMVYLTKWGRQNPDEPWYAYQPDDLERI